MKVEETIQTLFDKFPASCAKREQVLFHIFCMYGTGFEWKDGEIVDTDSDTVFHGKLGDDGKAVQKKSDEETAIEFTYESALNFADKDKIKASLDQFKDNIKALPEQLKNYTLKPAYKAMEQLRESPMQHAQELMCRNFSPIFNIPEDIKPDWADALKEVNEIIKNLNINLDSVK